MQLAPGTSEAVNPSLELSSDATTAIAGFTFHIADSYKVCYKVSLPLAFTNTLTQMALQLARWVAENMRKLVQVC